jgi:hypothetical protein
MATGVDGLRTIYRRARRIGGRGKAALRRLKHHLTPKGRGPLLLSARRRPTLEIHLPISPTPCFLNMVHCFALSLRRNGGAYRDTPIIATVGDHQIDPELSKRLPWLKSNGVELRWTSAEDYKRLSYFAQGQQRLMYDYGADVIALMDADMLIEAPIDDLIDAVHHQDVVAGVIAHCDPFERLKMPVCWEQLFAHLQMRPPRPDYEYTAWGYYSLDEGRRYCPAYFNYGMVCLPRAFARRIGAIHEETRARVREIAAGCFDAQIALAVAIARLGLPVRAVPMRYNFPNSMALESLHAAEIPHARILHLLGTEQTTKEKLYQSVETLQAFANAAYPRVINAKAQRIIRDIFPRLVAEQKHAAPLRPAS